ncbi:phosphoglycerate mutase family protein [Methanolobus vulcani]|uniref:Phosphoglycerate mutase family protein n=2 Tax=Methanolobus vulcani TaxID=38026 RepID=A0A7Z8KPI0_9EURY|nr:phosphoglycerate mutase family protein [Methanolobus vulcani]
MKITLWKILSKGGFEMENLPESFLKSLDKVQDMNQKKLILIRHSDRENILPGTLGSDVHITLEGKEKAFELGRVLTSLPIEWCKTSPLLRCTQTNDSIGDGYGKRILHSISKLLGEPGPFVFDGDQAINAFFDYGPEAVVREMIKGQSFPGIRSSGEGSVILLKGLIKFLEEGTGDGICISHDSILMPFIAHYCGEQFNGKWIKPLDGVVLVKQENAYALWWDGQMYKVVV